MMFFSVLLIENLFFILGKLARKSSHSISTNNLFLIKPYSLLMLLISSLICKEYLPSIGDIAFIVKSLFIFFINRFCCSNMCLDYTIIIELM